MPAKSHKNLNGHSVNVRQAGIASAAPAPKIVVRSSGVHGRGVYAGRLLKKGERVIEYKGERITTREADRRPPSDPDDDSHTFLFALDDGKYVLDGSVGGNQARWINHSCAPNCETEEDEGRVFIHALRDIAAGEELFYDYGLVIDCRLTAALKAQYRCLCGAPECRGTMFALKDKRRGKAAAKSASGKKDKANDKADSKSAGRSNGKLN
jgi:uncharacterized protein